MKTLCTSLVFICVLIFAAQAQTITSCTPNNAAPGQSLTVSILGSGTNFNSATSTYLFNGFQYVMPASWSALSATNITATYNISPIAQLGSYNVVVANSSLQTLPNGFFIGPGAPGALGEVRGQLYHDANSSCSFQFGESAYGYRIVEFLPGPYYALSDANGYYTVFLPLGTYTASFVPGSFQAPTCPVSATRTVTLTTNGQILTGQDFASNVVPFRDGSVTVSGPLMRPGFNTSLHIRARSNGTVALGPGVVKFKKPSFTSVVSAGPGLPTVVGDTLIWSFGALAGFTTYTIELNTPANVPIGTTYSLEAWIEPNPIDDIVPNNAFAQNRVITGAYDPNDKRVFLPYGRDADTDITRADSLLTYVVRFQNTGTDTAFNVFIRDTIDVAHLDMSSFRMIEASHSYRLLTSGNAGQLEITFPNILLPDSGANPARSQGYFMYQIKQRNNLPIGTIIHNSASIYFDYNQPVITNTTHTRICDVLAANYSSSSNALTTQFTDQSTGTVASWLWNFGDGATSTLQNPSHTYAANGSYNVCLITQGICRSDTSCSLLSVCAPPVAAMTSTPLWGSTLQFTDNSQHPNTWLWDFGDGSTSTLQSPSHTYTVDGSYNVCLIVQNSCGTDTTCSLMQVCGAPVVAGYASTTTGLTADFTDASTNGQTYAWDFGDGGTSTAMNPSHTYAAMGTYQVCLTTTSACGTTDQHCTSIFVCVAPVTTWNFTQPAPGNIMFTDGSQNATTWYWTFGDGSSSGLQNPAHIFIGNNNYTICLVTTNACGSDTSCTTLTICPTTLQAGFTSTANQFTYQFVDQSVGEISYAWDFGDGGTSTTASPTHTYASNGTYTACLTVTDLCGTTNTVCTTNTISVVGVANALPGFSIAIMPNPMGSQATILVNDLGVGGEYEFNLYDVSGTLVRSIDGQLNAPLVLERRQLAAGTYIFRIQQNGLSLGNGRIVVE